MTTLDNTAVLLQNNFRTETSKQLYIYVNVHMQHWERFRSHSIRKMATTIQHFIYWLLRNEVIPLRNSYTHCRPSSVRWVLKDNDMDAAIKLYRSEQQYDVTTNMYKLETPSILLLVNIRFWYLLLSPYCWPNLVIFTSPDFGLSCPCSLWIAPSHRYRWWSLLYILRQNYVFPLLG